MDSLFENVGEKIKGLAKVNFVLGGVAWFVLGLVLLYTRDNIFMLALLWLGGWYCTYTFSVLIYGWGQLICNTNKINVGTVGRQDANKISPSSYSITSTDLNKWEYEGLIKNKKIVSFEKLEHSRNVGIISEEEYQRILHLNNQ